MKIFKRTNSQETVEIETEIDPTVEIETIQEITTQIEAGIEETTEINIEIEVQIEEIVETIQEIETEVELEIGLIPEKEEETSQDLDQVRYFDRNDFCNYCNRTGHATHRCFRLENYLKKKGKRIVLHDDDDDVLRDSTGSARSEHKAEQPQSK